MWFTYKENVSNYSNVTYLNYYTDNILYKNIILLM